MLPGTRDEYSATELRERAQRIIHAKRPDITIYTDGSAQGDQTKGGAGVYIENAEGGVIWRSSEPAGLLSSSFNAEAKAADDALNWIAEENLAERNILLLTDSKSLVEAVQNTGVRSRNDWMNNIKRKLQQWPGNLDITWIPSHVGIEGNEYADILANAGALKEQEGIPVCEDTVRAKLKNTHWQIRHERARETYGNRYKPKREIEECWPRQVEVEYGRLRTGHSTELGYYKHMLDNTKSELCPKCGEEEETIRHLLQDCVALMAKRQEIFGVAKPPLQYLVEKPEECRRYLEYRFPTLKTGV